MEPPDAFVTTPPSATTRSFPFPPLGGDVALPGVRGLVVASVVAGASVLADLPPLADTPLLADFAVLEDFPRLVEHRNDPPTDVQVVDPILVDTPALADMSELAVIPVLADVPMLARCSMRYWGRCRR